MCVASRLVTARPLAPKSQAAWNPRLACDVTQILLGGTWPRTMVQAEAHRPSMITLWPELRSASYLSRYVPIRPPRSSPIRTTAWLAETPASRRTIASTPVMNFMSRPNPLLHPNLMVLRDAIVERVVRSRFCPDSQTSPNQIQIKCCALAALFRIGPKPEQRIPVISAISPRSEPFIVHPDVAACFNPFVAFPREADRNSHEENATRKRPESDRIRPQDSEELGEATMAEDADVIVVGAGLAGLVAAAEIADAGKHVIVVEQEGEQSLGGQAFWSLGGLLLVNTPEQRRLGIKDSYDLALQDWIGSAGFDRDEDLWPRRWAEAYVAFAAGEKRAWLRAMGHRIFPVVGWAERGGYDAMGHGNSVPRFHVTWGTGPGIVEPFARRAREAERQGRLTFKFRHRVDSLNVTGGTVDGIRGGILEADPVERGQSSSRKAVGDFTLRAQAVIVASGGIG